MLNSTSCSEEISRTHNAIYYNEEAELNDNVLAIFTTLEICDYINVASSNKFYDARLIVNVP